MPQQIDKIRAALGAVKRRLRPTAEWAGLELVWDRHSHLAQARYSCACAPSLAVWKLWVSYLKPTRVNWFLWS